MNMLRPHDFATESAHPANPRPGTGFVARAAMVLLCSALVTATAAPIMPGLSLPHDVRSTAEVTQIILEVYEMPRPLRDAGITEEEIRKVWRRRLTQAGIEIVEEDAPTLRLKVDFLDDEDVPDAAGILALMTFVQDVSVTRLDERLSLPTFTQYTVGLDVRRDLERTFEPAIFSMIDAFVRNVRHATNERKRN